MQSSCNDRQHRTGMPSIFSMAETNEFPMSQWISCKVVRCEPPLYILPTMAGFWCEGAPARRVFGIFCSVATRDQLQKTTFISGNLTLWRFSKVLSRKTENCPRKCYNTTPATQHCLRKCYNATHCWLPSNGSKVIMLERGTAG